MIKRYRYRAYPTPGQQQLLSRAFGCARVVYNDFIHARMQARKEGLKAPSGVELQKRLITRAKMTPERQWLSDSPNVCLQQSARDADTAYKNFFAGLKKSGKSKKVGVPRFKKKSSRQALRFTKAALRVQETTHGKGFVTVTRIGRIAYSMSRPLPAPPSSVSIIMESDGRYYVSFVVDEPATPYAPATNPARAAGIDLGLTDFAALVYSDGTREKIDNPRLYRRREKKLGKLQRSLSRKKKGSNNREKARHKVATAHRKLRDARSEFLKDLGLRLIRENQTISLETLSIRGLMRTRQAKSVSDASWGAFISYLKEKAGDYGREVIGISQWEPTSQVCSVCGVKDGKKPLNVRKWTCGECGTRLDRDYNAAVNIMVAAGLAETLNACRGSVRRQLAAADPVKQEPSEATLSSVSERSSNLHTNLRVSLQMA